MKIGKKKFEQSGKYKSPPARTDLQSGRPWYSLFWTDPDGRCPTCPQGKDAAALYAVGAIVTNQYGSWTWTGTAWVENPMVKEYVPDLADEWREGNVMQQFTYGLVDAPYSLFNNHHLGGRGFENYDDKMRTRLSGLLTIAGPILKTGVAVGNAAKTITPITKNSVIQGFKVSNHAWRKSGLGRGATEELIENVITGARNSGTIITETGTGKFSGNVINIYNHSGVKIAVDETRQLIMSIRPDKGFKLP